VGGAIVGAAAERMMHGDEDTDLESASTTAPTEADIAAGHITRPTDRED
jgi:hypothetical protein